MSPTVKADVVNQEHGHEDCATSSESDYKGTTLCATSNESDYKDYILTIKLYYVDFFVFVLVNIL